MFSSLALIIALAGGAQHWTAISTTAMSITGDVTFAPSKMTFSNGKSIAIARIAHTAAYTLYKVVGSANPSLLRGNTICGPKPPGYLAVSRKGSDVLASFFWAGAAPHGLDGPSLCGTFSYEAR